MEPPFDDVTSMPLNVKRRARHRVIFLLNGITDRRRHRLVSVRSFRLRSRKNFISTNRMYFKFSTHAEEKTRLRKVIKRSLTLIVRCQGCAKLKPLKKIIF